MLSDLNKSQKVFMIIVFCLTGISLLFGGFALYNIISVEKPWTIGVAYASKIEVNENSVPIVNIKIYENKNGNGETVYDMQFNSYTDTKNQGIAGFGIQCVGDYAVFNRSGIKDNTVPTAFTSIFNTSDTNDYTDYINKVKDLKVKRLNKSTIYGDFHLYYTGDNGVTYHTLPDSKVDNFLLITISGSNYKLTLKDYSYTYEDKNAWQEFWGLKGKTVEVKTAFTWYEVFQHTMNSAKDNSGTVEFEEYSLSLFDLSDYLDIQYMDDNGQYHNMAETTENRTYLTIPVTYSAKGATQASDSLFKQIASSPTWSYYSDTDIENYWNAYAELSLTEANVNFVYNEAESAYYITLDEKFSEYLKGLSNAEISINLDLTALDFEIYGIDLQNFSFDIEAFEISTTLTENFKIYNSNACSVTPTLKAV